MNGRASLQLTTSKRGPPRLRHVPDAPVGGYHVTTASQPMTSEVSVLEREKEIARAIAELDELDRIMLQIEHEIPLPQSVLDDPSSDGWDRLDAEKILDPLIDHYTDLSWRVRHRAEEISTHGAFLIGEWGDDELIRIGRHLSYMDGALPRVLAECPGIETTAAWQVLVAEGCPF